MIHNPLILNFLPIRGGGGLQNALSFVSSLGHFEELKQNVIAVVRKNSTLETMCDKIGLPSQKVRDTQFSRLCFELQCRSKYFLEQACFTLFGPPMLLSRNYMLNITGCAYSNLFYPEIPFWSFLSGTGRLRKEIIDWYRRISLTQADYWIFETEAIRRRAIKLCGFPEDRVGVVRMAPSFLIGLDSIDSEKRTHFQKRLPGSFKFLFLCGAHPNKRIHLLPQLAEEIRHLGNYAFSFITTMDPRTSYAKKVFRGFTELGLTKYLCNIGPVSEKDCSSLIDCVQAMCTFSVLESFSNNFIEAWKMERPLVVTDSDWARDACGEAALYVKPDDIKQCAKALTELMDSEQAIIRLVAAGAKQLNSYPSPQKKIELYFQEFFKAINLGACPADRRKRIHWPSKCQD